MHEMQTIVTDVRGVSVSFSLSVCHAAQLGGMCSVCRLFGAAFAKSLGLSLKKVDNDDDGMGFCDKVCLVDVVYRIT